MYVIKSKNWIFLKKNFLLFFALNQPKNGFFAKKISKKNFKKQFQNLSIFKQLWGFFISSQFFLIKTSSDIKMIKSAIEYQKYLSFLPSKSNYFFQFAMGYPVKSISVKIRSSKSVNALKFENIIWEFYFLRLRTAKIGDFYK